jgi:RNA polymerase sigma-70 factor (ECF subfamily)
MLEDWRLVQRFNQGDREAFRSIYEKYHADLLRVARVLLCDPDGMEDAVHDVMLNFASQAGRFRLIGSLKGYLAICVANRSRDMNRMRARQQARQVEFQEEKVPHSGDGMDDPEATGRIAAALNQLPLEQSEIIVLHLQQSLRFREIARQKQTSINTIMSRYRYGLEKLRVLLGD